MHQKMLGYDRHEGRTQWPAEECKSPDRIRTMSISEAWTVEEVESAVADYLHMLTLELAGQAYNKAAHRRALQVKLRNRSESSIEKKHQNISAILIRLGCPYIVGYKPLFNYQAILFDVVQNRIAHDTLFDRAAVSAVEQPAVMPLEPEVKLVVEDAPLVAHVAEQKSAGYRVHKTGIQKDYLEREARNRSLGDAGEEFVLAYERQRLHAAGKCNLSDRVEHVSKTKGDGLGFDILSYETNGRERFVEVKTTTFGKETPFFISRNEAELSEACSDQFHLYRLFEFRRQPRMFDLSGKVQQWVRLDPVTYLARFA